MNKKLVNEIFWIRATCCLAVVLFHSIAYASILYPSSTNQEYFFYIIRMSLVFATPAFVFMSEFLLGKSYPNSVPKDFIKKRFNLLFLPYLFMCIVYAFLPTSDASNSSNVLINALKNIFLGGATVYFVLIIFQFYFLHMIFAKHLNKWSPKYALPIAFFINAIYLAFFNFTSSPKGAIAEYIWDRGYWMPFIGWLFYFALGYYTGKYFTVIKENISRYTKLILLSVFLSFSLMVFNRYFNILYGASSKNVDVLFYTTSIILLMFFVFSKLNTVPNFIMMISNYSFSIYLVHQLFIRLLPTFENENTFVFIVYTFLFSLILSILVTYLINRLTFGKYIIGPVRSFSKKDLTPKNRAS